MSSLLRILDANLNRAREALRVIEDLARFHRNDARASALLKDARHSLDRLARPLASQLLAARDSIRDVGRDGDRPVESGRSPREILAANLKRAGEALRTIEEVSKGRYAGLAREAHRRRYDIYAIEKSLGDPRRLLDAARL